MSDTPRHRYRELLTADGCHRWRIVRLERTPGNLESDLFVYVSNPNRLLLVDTQFVKKWRGGELEYVAHWLSGEKNLLHAHELLNDFHKGCFSLNFDYLRDVVGGSAVEALLEYGLFFDEETENLKHLRHWVYLLRGKERKTGRTVYKIGFTAKDDPMERIRQVKRHTSTTKAISNIEEIAKRRGSKKLEADLHALCWDFNVPISTDKGIQTEWFGFTSEKAAIFTFLNGWLLSEHRERELPERSESWLLDGWKEWKRLIQFPLTNEWPDIIE